MPTRADRAAALLERIGVGPVARRIGLWKGILVLNYHRMGSPDGSGFARDLWSATAEDFDAHLRMLKRNFDVVSPADLLERPITRRRRILLTFDDGYRDSYEIALPILRRHGLPATFFIVPGFIDDPGVSWWDEICWMVDHAPVGILALPEHGLVDIELTGPVSRNEASALLAHVYKGLAGGRTNDFLELLGDRTGAGRCPREMGADLWMSWDQVRELRDEGMTIGGHSLTHPVLARLDHHAQSQEIEGCAQRLREELGVHMEFFSYPVGLDDAYDLSTRELLEHAGVRLAFAYTGGYSDRAIADPMAVPRASVAHTMSITRFAASLTAPQLFARW
jgi:peptidoglycan/xylan/chitin deacetylase (PgdA/CDA1 family)